MQTPRTNGLSPDSASCRSVATWWRHAALLAVLTLTGTALGAQTSVFNQLMDSPSPGTNTIVSTGTNRVATSFTVSQAVELSQIRLWCQGLSGTTYVTVFTDGAGEPDTQLDTASGATPNPSEVLNLNYSGGAALVPGETYWAVMNATVAYVQWFHSSTSLSTNLMSSDGGASWTAAAGDDSRQLSLQVLGNPLPVVNSINRASGAYSNSSTVSYSVSLSQSVTGLNASAFSLTTTGVTGASIIDVAGSGTSWTVTVSTGTGEGTIRLDMVDGSGTTPQIQGTPFEGQVYTMDYTPPDISIGAPSVSATGSGPVDFVITYTGASSITLSEIDVVLNETGSVSVGLVSVTGSGTTSRTVTLSNITGDGEVTISINSGTAADLAGNLAAAVGPSAAVTIIPPPVIFIQPASMIVGEGESALLAVGATGTGTLVYQWYERDEFDVDTPVGVDSPLHVTDPMYVPSRFWVRVSNAGAYVDSNIIVVGVAIPPTITTQPQSQYVAQGQPTTLSVSVSGTSPFYYEWFRGNSGDTSNPEHTFTPWFDHAYGSSGGTSYWVRVTNSAGSVNSAAAVITEIQPPVITAHPGSQTIGAGTSANLSVSATGSGTLSYQWYTGHSGYGSQISGATSSTYNTGNLSSTTSYWVRVSNQGGSAYSNTAVITVEDPPTYVSGGIQPMDTTSAGTQVSISASFDGSTPMTFQWYEGTTGDTNTPLAGETSTSLSVSPTVTTSYWLAATNQSGTGNSPTFTVTVLDTVQITAHPQDESIISGNSASLSVTATGGGTLTYQWYQGSSGDTSYPMLGATSATLAPVPPGTTSYWVRVSNAVSHDDSNTATVYPVVAPSITTHPVTTNIVYTQVGTLSVVANAGNGTLAYQWYEGLSGDTSTPVGTDSATFQSGVLTQDTQYWVRVTNIAGHADSNEATIKVHYAPVINQHPQPDTIHRDQSAQLSVDVTGTSPVVYQWYAGQSGDTSNPVGPNNATLNTGPLTQDTYFWVRVSNFADTLDSNHALITVLQPPTITAQPQSDNVLVGHDGHLSVTATGEAPLEYQWYEGTSGDTSHPIMGALSSTLTVMHMTGTGSFWVRVSNIVGQADSITATLTVHYPPVITTQPQHQTIVGGSNATLSVVATSTLAASYQWYEGVPGDTSMPVNGGGQASVQVSPAGATYYWVRVSNAAGSVDSTDAVVEVIYAPVITTQPQPQTINAGQNANLSVVATDGNDVLTYQWYEGQSGDTSQPIQSATQAALSPSPSTDTEYWVRVANFAGHVDSNSAAVTVIHPPVITTHPANEQINAGSSASLSVAVTGTAPFTYQWYEGQGGDTSNPATGATAATYAPSPTADTTYWVRVSNPAGHADSNAATVTVIHPPVITTHPQDEHIATGNDANLSVAVSGTAPFTYQWYEGQSGDTSHPIQGATAAAIAPSPTVATMYWVRISNPAGQDDSTAATVTVVGPPVITTQPQEEVINLGQQASLSVVADTGNGTLTYQWYESTTAGNGTPVQGATSDTFNPSPTTDMFYRVRVSNLAGYVDSNYVSVKVIIPPAITTHPADAGTTEGLTVALSVAATGTPDFDYQWYEGASGDTSIPVQGATEATFTSSQLWTDTSFWVRVSNPAGHADSDAAAITVGPNTAPTITAGSALTLPRTATVTGYHLATVGDVDEPAPDLHVFTAAIMGVTVTVTGIDANGVVTADIHVGPSAELGDHALNVTVRDAANDEVIDTLILTITENTAPTIDEIADIVINVNSNSGLINIDIDDAEEDAAGLQITAESDNGVLIDNILGFDFGGHGTQRTLVITPEAWHAGLARITLTVTDAGGLSASTTFNLEVQDLAHAPTIQIKDEVLIKRANRSAKVSLHVNHPQDIQMLHAPFAFSSNHALIPDANIVITGSAPNFTVEVTPAEDAVGETIITVGVSDGNITSTRSFLVTVDPDAASSSSGSSGGCAQGTGASGLWLLALVPVLFAISRRRRNAKA